MFGGFDASGQPFNSNVYLNGGILGNGFGGGNSMVYYGFHIIILIFVLHFIMPHFDGSVLRYLVFCIISTGAIISVITLINVIVLKTPLKILIGKSGYKSATKTDKVKGGVCDGK